MVLGCKVPCYHPIQAYQHADGRVAFVERTGGDLVRSLQLRCGQCVGCRLERSRQWAVRCMHEAQCHEYNSFVTLTYENAPVSLEYRDFQLFMKRVRARFRARIRFYMAGEYGEANGRPHFHAILFGVFFSDRKEWGKSATGFTIYRSAVLESLWPHGYSSIGDVSFESAAYVARYIMKKVNGSLAEVHYEYVDEDGEVKGRTPEFNRMSLKPGIGAAWYEKYKSDVFPEGMVVANGVKSRAPRYYDKKYAVDDPDGWSDVEYRRDREARAAFADNSDARLAVKETVAEARVNFLKRGKV